MKLFTRIRKDECIEDDVVKIHFIKILSNGAKTENIEHAICKNGKFLSVIDNEEIIFNDEWKTIDYYLHNYRFIAKEDTWYIEGTEVYPDHENWDADLNGWKLKGWTLFQGLTYKENFNEMEGTGPCWDGETCQFDEFEIVERKNQTRKRKLIRLLK